jgi:outer membrane immunogenic protein
MKKLLAAVIGAVLLYGAAASAADTPVKAPPIVAATPTWAGFYIGINGGYGWQTRNDNLNYVDIGGLENTGSGFDARGGFGGGQIGYNLQSTNYVYGIEADFEGSGIRGSFSQSPAPGAFCCGPGDIFAGASKLDWFGTLRGRLGYAFDRSLLYVTGGLAYGHLNQTIVATNPAIPVVFYNLAFAQTKAGYVLGAGYEYKITPAWSLRVEYQYLDFGSDSLSSVPGAPNPTAVAGNVQNSFNTARIGLNYFWK